MDPKGWRVAWLALLTACGPGPDNGRLPITDWEAVLTSADVVPQPAMPTNGRAIAALGLTSGTTVAWTITITTPPASAITNIVLANVAAGGTITATTPSISLGTSCTSPCTGTVTLTAAQLATLQTFGWNITIRTTTAENNSGSLNGELRGQVRNVPPGD
jgi:CHRD domain-containing protein